MQIWVRVMGVIASCYGLSSLQHKSSTKGLEPWFITPMGSLNNPIFSHMFAHGHVEGISGFFCELLPNFWGLITSFSIMIQIWSEYSQEAHSLSMGFLAVAGATIRFWDEMTLLFISPIANVFYVILFLIYWHSSPFACIICVMLLYFDTINSPL